MRAKYVWAYVPLPHYFKLFWERVTFSRLTVVYLIFSILHFLLQLGLQTRALLINTRAFDSIDDLVKRSSSAIDGLPFYDKDVLRICNWVPSNLNVDVDSCQVIWSLGDDGSQVMNEVQSNSSFGVVSSESSALSSPTTSSTYSQQTQINSPSSTAPTTESTSATVFGASTAVVPVPTSVNSARTIPSVTVATVFVIASPSAPSLPVQNSPPSFDNSEANTIILPIQGDDDESDSDDESGDEDEDDIELDRRDDIPNNREVCLRALNYPLSTFGNTKREDIVFIAFQFWVLGTSIVALLNESIPHVSASLLTHIMATGWGIAQIIHTASFRSRFKSLITEGACKGITLPITTPYWENRKNAEIASLSMNVLALIISCILTWRLFKLFGWQTFKRVGASLAINRMYKLVLVLSIAIQLSLFFLAVTVSLWLDRLVNSVIGDLADFRKAYIATSIVVLVLLVPWLTIGWCAVRRELNIPMWIFLGFALLYLGGWSIMFLSTTFRWTFITWNFFAIMATASVLLTVISFILGVLCRLNFGKGLVHHLSSQQMLPGDDFPILSPGRDIEKVNFPSTEKPIPTFTTTYGDFFMGRPLVYTGTPGMVQVPPQALTRSDSDASSHSHTSDTTMSGYDSYYRYPHSRDNSLQNGPSKRWVIE